MNEEEEVLRFIQAHIKSVYTLEALLLIKRDRKRGWRSADLVRDLRSSRTAVADAMNQLIRMGLVSESSGGGYTYDPQTPEYDQIANAIEKIYTAKPMSVVKTVLAAPDEKLRAFSDAFKLKE